MSYEKEIHKALSDMTNDELEQTIVYRRNKVCDWEEALDRALEEQDKRLLN